jgi:DNA-binding Xre family transcriptional regulator
MLSLNLKRVFALRGIENPGAFMVNAGIGRQTATNLLRQQTSIVKIEHLALLCRLLNCTPNDFFEWHGGDAHALHEKHALNNLKRHQVANNGNSIKDIPLEQVEEMIRSS